jgi:predicted ATPase
MFLRPKRVLLLLDNCEHLVVACAHVIDALLRVCVRLTILATSRAAIGITGERPWRVPSLTVPDLGSALTEDRLLASKAGQLFVQRVRLVRPEFRLIADRGQPHSAPAPADAARHPGLESRPLERGGSRPATPTLGVRRELDAGGGGG